jgi:hypothetical protein
MNPESPSGTALTFPWGDRPRSLWRLLPYTLICAAALTSLAFIFKSKTPAPTPSHFHSPSRSHSRSHSRSRSCSRSLPKAYLKPTLRLSKHYLNPT